jgi:hypothetical protein
MAPLNSGTICFLVEFQDKKNRRSFHLKLPEDFSEAALSAQRVLSKPP